MGRRSGIRTFVHQGASKFHAVGEIHGQHIHGCSADWRLVTNFCALQLKLGGPVICSRMDDGPPNLVPCVLPNPRRPQIREGLIRRKQCQSIFDRLSCQQAIERIGVNAG